MSLYKCPHCGAMCGSIQEGDGSVTYGSCGCANKDVLKRIGASEPPRIKGFGEGISEGSIY